jgi:hypothetical protein
MYIYICTYEDRYIYMYMKKKLYLCIDVFSKFICTDVHFEYVLNVLKFIYVLVHDTISTHVRI